MAELRNVFVAGGMPSITYVDRASLNLERNLKTEIREGYKIICITGPTKSGKTVLTKHVIGRNRSVTVNGGQVRGSTDLWIQLLQSLRLPSQESIEQKSEDSAGFNYILNAQAKASEGSIQTFNNTNKNIILEYIRNNDLALIVDDFHYMPDEVQKEIVRSVKSEIFDGLTVILIAVPHRAFDAIGIEREMEGRFSHIEIPSWSQDELEIIALKGFPELGMKVPASTVQRFTSEANGSPLLMQRFCNRLCDHFDIERTVKPSMDFNPSDDTLVGIFSTVAKQFGFPTFDKLSRGPQSRSKRRDRKSINGTETLDIYQSVLRAIVNTGPKEKIHYNEIREELRKILVDTDVPQKHEVSSALGHMSGIARDKIEGEPVIEWADDYLHITDPFLMFFMRWSKGGVV